ncbi:MAG: hypothetical protein HFJ04_01945 [Lachnospiraceae bacterium]|nr:hypothetical protein [Lachnospiraceae bacterium]
MRLIDRDLLLSEIEKSRGKNPHKDSKIRVNHTIEHDHIAHLVLEQPVAYDVDKVVERLEVNSMFAQADDEPFVMLDDAVEIVKSGGIE